MGGLFGGGKAQAKERPAISGLQLQTSANGKVVPLVYGTTRIAPNLLWYGDFTATPKQSTPPSSGKGGVVGGGGGKGGGGSSGGFTYSAAVILGLCEGPIAGVGSVWASKTQTTAAALGLSIFTGTYPQAAWSYLATNHPSQALPYPGIAYAAAGPYRLGDSAQLPNNNFEVQGAGAGGFVSGVPDADPSFVISDLLTNAHYGVGFPAARLGDLSAYRGYCGAAGLWISPAYTDQAQASSMLDDIARYSNSAFVWSSGTLTLVPYGDTALSANGFSYTPPAQPLYDLTDDDFLPNANAGGASASGNSDPVLLTRKRPADANNTVKLEFLDRANQYNPGVVEATDQAMVDLYGRRSASQSAHLFADANAARQAAQLLLQREAIRNVYQFTLDQRYVLLDPMDIVTLTDANLGLNRQWVRVTEITENDDGTLSVAAEEYLQGTGAAAAYSFNTGAGYAANWNVAPGNAVAPILFEAPVQIAASGLEVWLATAGGPNWGGCDVYVSSDGNTYKFAGRKNGPSRLGVLSAALPAGPDPDKTDTLAVDLSESAGALLSGTQADADAYHTLCYVDGELLSYETATLTGASKYNLTYLRRGAYGTAIAAHAQGSSFARLDDGIFTLGYDKGQIGQTVHVKLLSFNIWGGGEQALSDVAAYTHVIAGPPPPGVVAGFTAQQNGNTVTFAWSDLSDFALKGYDILYGPQGGSVAGAILLTAASRATEMTNAAVPPGAWTFYIRGHDIADQLGPVSSCSLTVTNTNIAIAALASAPDWLGTVSGFFRHYTGVLVPLGTKSCASYADWSWCTSYVADPWPSPSYTTPALDTGFNDNLRVWFALGATPGPGVAGSASVATLLDSWPSGGSDPGSYAPWSVGSVDAEFFRGQLVENTAVPAYISAFTLNLDAPQVVERVNGFAVAASGTSITFASAGVGPFHTPPNIQVTPADGSSTSGGASAITTTSATIQLFTGATPVAGTCNLIFTGE